ncbi:MAG: threonine synthase [Alphaproteobacteria bacterium]|jgi:threonine synthase|nr:threonine synthase [Alphaproteobacteria bacterium]
MPHADFYVSSRGTAPRLGFSDTLLAGLADDGGLYVPEAWPALPAAARLPMPYAAAAEAVMSPFVGGDIPPDVLARLIREAYAGFDHADVVPLVEIAPDEWLLELFHGPTLAFKDLALQLLGRLFDHLLGERRSRVTIVGATSGDTGSAAIHACRGRDNIDIFILHPAGRVSEVQRRQMTTVADANVHNIAIDGTFDDCQALVKAMFADVRFRGDLNLSAVNSINWARVMAQIVYYVSAAARLAGKGPVTFSVPTGNFGDVYAGYGAHRMGLDVARLVVATNRNDILARALGAGDYHVGTVSPTMSPSMDIQVSSNFERLLFELYDRDAGQIRALMAGLATENGFTIAAPQLARAQEIFSAARVDEEQTLATMAQVHAETGMLVDPHSAVGICAGRAQAREPGTPLVMLATAHPAKFPDAVAKATGRRPEPPAALAAALAGEERCADLPHDLTQVQTYIRARAMR